MVSERDEQFRSQEAERVRRPFIAKVEVTLKGKVEIDGSIEDVLSDSDFEPALIRRIDLRAGEYLSTGDRVSFRADNDGARLELKGARSWVDSNAVRLEREMERCVPWWTYTRAWPSYLALYVIGMAVWAKLGGFTVTDEFPASDAVGSWFGWSAIWMAGATALMAFIGRFVVPGVEVVESGTQSRGRWAMGVVGTLTLSVLGSVIVAVVGLA